MAVSSPQVGWSREDIALFERHYACVPGSRLGQMINKSEYRIRLMAKEYGWLADPAKRTLSESELSHLKANWPRYGMALGPLRRELNMMPGALRDIAKAHNLPLGSPKANLLAREHQLIMRYVKGELPFEALADELYYRPRYALERWIVKMQSQEKEDGVVG